MDKKNNIELTRFAFIATGIIIFVIGLLLVIENDFDMSFSVVCTMAVILLSANLLYHIGKGDRDRDERLAMVGNEAMSLSWYVTLVVILLSLALNSVVDVGLTTGRVLGISLMVMISAMVGYNELMVRREVTA